MSVDRKRKIGLLVRKNQAKREHPYYLTELSHILKQRITEKELLDLEMTDNLFSRSMSACKNSQLTLQRTWPLHPHAAWNRVCLCLAERLGSELAVLFVGPFRFCGAVNICAEYPLVNASSFLEFDKDGLSMQSLSSDGGLYLDIYEENAVHRIELKVWGAWCSRAEKCLM